MYRDLIGQVLERLGCMPKASDEGFTSRCPFHADNSPSFAIRADGVYTCYTGSCGARGNIRSFLRGAAKYTPDKIEALVKHTPRAAPTGITLVRPYGQREPEPEYVSERLVAIYSAFCPQYMLGRGFSKQTLKHFEVGFDVDNARVMIPVRTPNADLMGFVRRATREWDEPRYYVDVIRNRRNAILFNVHNLQPGGEVVVVEGVMDCMWLHQLGVFNVVALLGTTLTRQQEVLLKRSFDSFTLMLDNDSAGRSATRGHIRRLQRHGPVRVAADFPAGKDAADNEPDDVLWALDNAVYGPEWLVHRTYSA